MKFDEKKLKEIEDHIKFLDDNYGLCPGTLIDIQKAIQVEREKLKGETKPITNN